ncbi:FadR/GntR family transcriptional regulator [Planotetraspora kaengkrachanensis]|uniref:FadR/GntR family transcriptional regulator n=1 Tax=Planotetraspora kaengkrachanensis TaxID=575193 RepID=UPI0019459CCD|nr:FCD domain-containing protein [Planotetraspora kaengkrachanensis]
MTSATPQPDMPAGVFRDSLEPIRQRRRRLGDTVVTYLVDRIVSGVYPVETVLPTEPELCQEFGVSRTVVRESIKLLEEKRLVKATPGRGTRVLEPIGWNLLDPVVLEAQIRHDRDLSILDNLVNVRAALECDMAAQCARVITPSQAEELTRQANVLVESMYDPERYAREDVTFHEMIMIASGNRLGHAIIHSIHAKARLSSQYNGTPNREHLVQSLAEHRQIESMILQGDAQGAAAAMRVHILGSWAKRRPGVLGVRP